MNFTDHEGNPIVDGDEVFLPATVHITNSGVVTFVTAYAGKTVSGPPTTDTHKNHGSWPDLP